MSVRIVAWSLAAIGIALIVLFNVLDVLNGHQVAPPVFGTPVVGAFLVVGALIASRRPQNPIGWIYLVAATLISFSGTGNVSDQYAYYALVTRPGALPAPDWVLWAGQVALAIAFGGLVFFSLLLFPDGRLPSPRWRPLAITAIGAIAALTVTSAISPDILHSAAFTVPNPVFIYYARALI